MSSRWVRTFFGKAIPDGALTAGIDTEGQRVAAGGAWTYTGTLTVADADEWTLVIHYSGIRPTR